MCSAKTPIWFCMAMAALLCVRVPRVLSFRDATDATNYNEDEAKMYLQAARASFCDKGPIERWNCGEMCDAVPVEKGSVRFIGPGKKSKVQAFVARLLTEQDHCVISFRGSVEFANWQADVKIWQEPWPAENADWCQNCSVHRGFAGAYGELRAQLRTAINELTCKTFVFTGHSLGAAMAQLMAIELRGEDGALVKAVYLYGSPRVGGKAFVDAFDKLAALQKVQPAAWHIIHYHDPIPRLPPQSSPWSYRSMSTKVVYNENETSYVVCSAKNSEDPRCVNSPSALALINLNHVTYLSKSLEGKDFPSTCISRSGGLASAFVRAVVGVRVRAVGARVRLS